MFFADKILSELRDFCLQWYGLHGCDTLCPSPFPIREIREIRGQFLWLRPAAIRRAEKPRKWAAAQRMMRRCDCWTGICCGDLLVPLAYCLGGFLIFYVAFDLIFGIKGFQDKHLGLGDIAEYYVVTLPEILVIGGYSGFVFARAALRLDQSQPPQ